MKFETTPAFDADFRRLKPEHAAQFRKTVQTKFAPACDVYAADPSRPWPTSLRVKHIVSAAGILEMTWSFASPDGRATFALVTVDGERRVRWRRVGDHAVFRAP
jgi:putative SOS response-associated peptidase YedK